MSSAIEVLKRLQEVCAYEQVNRLNTKHELWKERFNALGEALLALEQKEKVDENYELEKWYDLIYKETGNIRANCKDNEFMGE